MKKIKIIGIILLSIGGMYLGYIYYNYRYGNISIGQYFQTIILTIILFVIIGLPIYFYLKYGYIRSIEGEVISYKKKIWAVWSAIFAYGLYCFISIIITVTCLYLGLKNFDSLEFPEAEKIAGLLVLTLGGIYLISKAIRRIIQAYQNRFDRLIIFNDRIEIFNSGYIPNHLIIQYSAIKDYNLIDLDPISRGFSKYALKINHHNINLRDMNLNNIYDEIDASITKKLSEFRNNENIK
jgi:hypothetical protein